MKITDHRVNNLIEKKLLNSESFYLEGPAGCGKSSVIHKLKDFNFNNVLMLTPTNQLQLRHTERFSDAVDNFVCTTYASITDSVNRASTDYDADDKDIKVNAGIFIFDEVFAADVRSLKRMIKHANALNKPYILLGDSYQTTINKAPISRPELYKDIEGLLLTETMRGTELNLLWINTLYDLLLSGVTSVPAETLAHLLTEVGGNVSYDFPTNPNHQYGYTADRIEHELVNRIKFNEKIFNGKIRYKKDGSYGRLHEQAPIVSRLEYKAITKFTGIETPFATAKNTFSAITCIGVELDQEKELHLVFRKTQSIDLKSFYTLASRHIDTTKITMHLIDETMLPQQIFKKLDAIKVAGEYMKCTEQIYSVVTTDAFLNLSPRKDANNKQVKLLVTQKLFAKLLIKIGKPHTNHTKVIYTENYKIYPSMDGYGDLCTAIFFAFDNLNEDIKAVPDKMKTVLGELMQYVPGILCDPQLLHTYEDSFFTLKDLSCFLNIKPEKAEKPYTLAEQGSSDEELKSLDITDFITNPSTTCNMTSKIYEVDLKSSYWQSITNYPEFIGYGPLIPYDKNAKISYAIITYNEANYLLNNLIIDKYNQLGYKLEIIAWLASRNHTLDEYLTQEAKSFLTYCREIRFNKKSMEKWGTYSKPRYIEDKLIEGSDKKTVVVDNLYNSGLFLFQSELKSIQSLLVTATNLAQTEDFTIKADGIKSEKPMSFDWCCDFLKEPDRTYKEITTIDNQLNKKILAATYTHTKHNLQYLYDNLTEDKKPSRYPKKALKIKEKLDIYE